MEYCSGERASTESDTCKTCPLKVTLNGFAEGHFPRRRNALRVLNDAPITEGIVATDPASDYRHCISGET
jgi:hypothetical protein